MKKISFIIVVLLILDVLTTVYLLEMVPGTTEINPILNYFGNVILAVIISHIFAIIIVYAVDLELKKYIGKKLKVLETFLSGIAVFYLLVVSLNMYNILVSFGF
jgi:hypothetical protein